MTDDATKKLEREAVDAAHTAFVTALVNTLMTDDTLIQEARAYFIAGLAKARHIRQLALELLENHV